MHRCTAMEAVTNVASPGLYADAPIADAAIQ
jgi:hypothetical protein